MFMSLGGSATGGYENVSLLVCHYTILPKLDSPDRIHHFVGVCGRHRFVRSASMADVILEGAAGSIVILVNWALEMSTVPAANAARTTACAPRGKRPH
jgi:hypothetical protein